MAIEPAFGLLGVSSVTNEYDCCSTCMQTPHCGSSAFLSEQNTCYLMADSGTCAGNTTIGTFDINNRTSNDPFIISNGYCGQAQPIQEVAPSPTALW